MKKKIKRKYERDPDKPVGKLTRVKDFLPPPDQLIFPDDENVKVTITLTKSTVEYFKYQAKKNKTKYQKMIRKVLDRYAGQY